MRKTFSGFRVCLYFEWKINPETDHCFEFAVMAVLQIHISVEGCGELSHKDAAVGCVKPLIKETADAVDVLQI